MRANSSHKPWEEGYYDGVSPTVEAAPSVEIKRTYSYRGYSLSIDGKTARFARESRGQRENEDHLDIPAEVFDRLMNAARV